MDDQIANLIALGKGIEESRPDNAEELLALVHKMLCAHRSQYDAIEKLEKEFLAPFYDGYGDETHKQRHSRIAEIAAGTVSPNFTLHLFTRLEDAGLAMIRPLVALAQTRTPRKMAIPPYVDEQAIVNGRVITRRRKNNQKMPPEKLIESADNTYKEDVKKAADARHNKPGGSRELKDKICKVWATGKYSSRDVCAEEEWAALGFGSFSTARKALRNTKDPT